jgi:hypothetical protein
MSTKAQVKTPAKTPAAPAVARIPQTTVAVPEHEAERPDIAAQLEGAARLGHSLGAVRVDGAVMPIIQRQELPEEDEEKEELQMKREPAALERQELPEEEEEEAVQTKPANGMQRQGGSEGFRLDDETAGRISRARGGGQPLEGVLQEQMSASLGHDFSRVRVHTGPEADELNQQFQAKAFTTGRDMFFKRGAYDPTASHGRELIAHELTHVVQQSTGQVSGDGDGMTVRPAGDAFEQEADDMGREANHEIENRSRRRATSKPGWPSPADIEILQNTIGNRAVQSLLAHRQGGEEHKPAQAGRLAGGTHQTFTGGQPRYRADQGKVRGGGRVRTLQGPGEVVQKSRAQNPMAIPEEHYAVVGPNGQLAYSNLAAACIGVTAWFRGGGGMGYHLAQLGNLSAQRTELAAVRSARDITRVRLDGDQTYDDGWYYHFSGGNPSIAGRISSREALLERYNIESNREGESIYEAGERQEGALNANGWYNDQDHAQQWWNAYFAGSNVEIHMGQFLGPHTMNWG